MKKIYLLSAVALMGLASCDDFDDQFHLGNQIGDVKNATIELTDADYSTIANLSANKELAAKLDAESGTTAYTEALQKLPNQKYFGTMITADRFLPAFLQNKYPESDINSTFKVTYNEYCGKSEYLADFNNLAGEYTLTADDYNTAWEGKSSATYLTPATIGKMQTILDNALPDAEEGYLYAVNYAYQEFEPAGGSDTPEESYTKISDVVANTDGGEYTVKGIVCAVYARGFLLTDKTGYILVYKTSDVKIGDEVTVAGTTSQYAGLMQYSNAAEVTLTKAGKEPNYKQPNPTALTAADIDAYVNAPYVKYVTYTGKLTINGTYYNVAVDGATVQGSLSYVPEGMVDASLNGQNVIVYGYTIGAPNNKKYVNTMVTNVISATNSAKAKARAARAASNGANKTVVYQYVEGKWKIYSTDGAKVIAAQPEWYNMIGANTVAKPNNYFPTLLQREYPFAEDGQKVAVVYRKSSSALAVAEYTFSATEGWAESKEYKKESSTFAKTENGFEEQISTYLNSTLCGDEGGFTIYNVNLNTLNYVWQNTTSYGWKASAYANKTNTASESWLVSPALNMKKGKNPELVFDEAMNYLGSNNIEDFLSVKVSTNFDGNDVNAATWETLNITGRTDGASWTFYTVDPVSLSQFVGKTVHIAFVYKSTDAVAPTYEFKNI
ncbi:MAG TPA: hypothetical protein DEQ27_08960, partial [Prevotella sp.]|nr:hypothetical protein [Prevotella sp.]